MVTPLPKTIEAWCWQYPKDSRQRNTHFPGLHFTARAETCRFLLEVIAELRSGEVSHRSIPLRPLKKEDESKVTGGLKYEDFRSVRIAVHPVSDELRQMSFRVERDRAIFDFTVAELRQLEKGIRDVQTGTGDYCIGPKDDRSHTCGANDRASEVLWFWPCFGHLWVVP